MGDFRAATRRAACALVFVAAFVSSSRNAFAWTYPEHRDIVLKALEGLDPDQRRAFDAVWVVARSKHVSRFCAHPDEAAQGSDPTCIDYAAWAGVAGDHSCSAADMLKTLTSDWMLAVADVAADLKTDLAKAKRRTARVNALRNSDIRLQWADPEYATRAQSNLAHFLLPRPAVNTTWPQYAVASLTEGVVINALASYSWYHVEALEKARALANPALTPDDRAALSLAMLADEAFGLHFLEDVFAAGHVAGTWGDTPVRKGTHDYYNEHGLEVTTWNGERVVLSGDAWMRPEDAARAAALVQRSLEQLMDAVRGIGPSALVVAPKPPSLTAGAFDVCHAETVPKRPHNAATLVYAVLRDTPVPMLTTGRGEMPRFRTEMGPFIGMQGAGRAGILLGSFAPSQDQAGAIAGLELGVRAGVGLEGVLNEAGDGLAFLDFGFRQDGNSTNQYGSDSNIPEAGAITAAVPGRFAYQTRIRLPFWLLPMDLLIAGPILLAVSPSTLQSMAVTAGNGGLIPWQAGIATRVGRFQFILGREVGVGLFGYTRSGGAYFVLPTDAGSSVPRALMALSSIQLEFPVIEYRPFRTFSSEQSSSIVFQLYGAVDIPSRTSLVAPLEGEKSVSVEPVWLIGGRMAFDWRYYL
jgi:hypothetical protein